jgi:hypothetical protein
LPQNETNIYAGLRYPVKKANDVVPYVDSVPIYEIGNTEGLLKYGNNLETDWVVLPEKYINTKYFVTRFSGKSKYDKVQPGDWCLFKSTDKADGKERYLVRDGDVLTLTDNPSIESKVLAEFISLLD